MNYQWYPGHMTRTKRDMQESIKLIDMVIEVLDARIPKSSQNPDIKSISNGKIRVIILNKKDLSDERKTRLWEEYFKEEGIFVVSADSRDKADIKKVRSKIDEAALKKRERDKKRGIMNRPVRAMIAGIPNVGKSTFINSFAGKASAKTGNRPGVTRGRQWIRLSKGIELLDTPGILWPKFDDEALGENLARTGAIKDDLINMQELSLGLIDFLRDNYPGRLKDRYGMEETGEDYLILEKISKARGCLRSGGQIDLDKASRLIVDDFRSGRLGRISLEVP